MVIGAGCDSGELASGMRSRSGVVERFIGSIIGRFGPKSVGSKQCVDMGPGFGSSFGSIQCWFIDSASRSTSFLGSFK